MPGLNDILAGSKTVDEVLLIDTRSGLNFLPSGPKSTSAITRKIARGRGLHVGLWRTRIIQAAAQWPLSTPLRKFGASSDGYDQPWLVDQFVPCVAAVVDDVRVGGEDFGSRASCPS